MAVVVATAPARACNSVADLTFRTPPCHVLLDLSMFSMNRFSMHTDEALVLTHSLARHTRQKIRSPHLLAQVFHSRFAVLVLHNDTQRCETERKCARV